MSDQQRGPRVLDLSVGRAGAYASLLLTWAGGHVTRAEPAGGDPMRDDAPLFGYLRQGQEAVAGPGGGALDVGGAEVVVATPTGAEADALRAARERDPSLVVVAVSPYGLDGPYADRPASDLTLQADSGALAIRGHGDRAPFPMGGHTVEYLAGAYAAVAARAWWRRAHAGGPGAFVDLSLCEVAHVGASNFMDVFHAVGAGVDAEPEGPPRQLETPSIERTADGWVGFNTNAPHQIAAFLRMIGRDDLADSGELMLPGMRIARGAWWTDLVTAWTSARPTAEIIELAIAHGVPVAPVCDGRTVTELDHVAARGTYLDAPAGGYRMPRRPWKIDGDTGPPPAPAPGPPPAPGERASPPAPAAAPTVPSVPDAASAPARPLEGIRVLDLTAWWAGPAATATFAALGADVIHVEAPGRMDGVRMVGASFPGRSDWWELSSFFLAVNSDKRDLVLDLASDRGRELALALVARADVVVENFTPRVLDKLGLGWDAIREANPRAVLVRMPAFGLDGPWRDRPGFAQNMEQASGLAWLTGEPDDQPRIQRGPCDPNGGLHAALAALVALDDRERTGRGALVEAAMFDAALAVAAEPVLAWTADGALLGRHGRRSPTGAPQGVYACAGHDRWLALTVDSDDRWRALAAAVDRPDLAAEDDLAHVAGRRAHHDRLDEALAAWAAERDLDAAVEHLAAAGVPAAPARDPRLAARHPQFVHRGYHEVVDHPVAGPVPVPTLPFRVDDVERWTRTPAPCFGQHNEEILGELLGLTADEQDRLAADGVIATRPAGT